MMRRLDYAAFLSFGSLLGGMVNVRQPGVSYSCAAFGSWQWRHERPDAQPSMRADRKSKTPFEGIGRRTLPFGIRREWKPRQQLWLFAADLKMQCWNFVPRPLTCLTSGACDVRIEHLTEFAAK